MLPCWNKYLLVEKWEENEKGIVMPTQLNGRWEQEQFDKWLPLKSASLSEQVLKNEKRRIEQTTRARELFSKEICCNLVYRPAGVIPSPPLFWKKNWQITLRMLKEIQREKNRKIEDQAGRYFNESRWEQDPS